MGCTAKEVSGVREPFGAAPRVSEPAALGTDDGRGPIAVLVVEDDPDECEVLVEVVRARGHRVTAVPTCAEALAELRERAFDLVLLDWRLPDGDGESVCLAVRSLRVQRDAYVLVVTGLTDAAELAIVLDAGADDYLAKPFDIGQLEVRLTVAERRVLRLRGLRERAWTGEETVAFQAQLLAAVGQAITATDLAGHVTYWNAAAEVLYGWRADEVRGRLAAEVTPSERQPEQAEERMARLAAGQMWKGVVPVRRKDGSLFQAHVTEAPVRDPDGRLIGVIAVSYDATPERAAQRQLVESAARFRALFEQAPQAIVMHGADGGILAVNDAVVRLIGYGRNEILANPALLSSHSPAQEEAGLAPARCAITGIPRSFTTVLAARDGRRVATSVTQTPVMVDGRLVGVYSVLDDLSERGRAERRLAAIVESSGDAIIGLDLDGVVTDWNRAAQRLYGFSAQEIVGTSITRVAPPEGVDEVPLLLERAQRGEQVEQFETVRLRKDGTPVRVSLTIAPVRDVTGEVAGAVVVARDVTESRRLENERRELERHAAESEKLRALGRLASGVAHDLNQSLALIAGHAEIAQSELASEGQPDGTALREALAVIREAAHDGGDTVRRLLGFARDRVVDEHQLVDLATLAEDVRRLTAPRWRDEAQADGRAIVFELVTDESAVVVGAAAELREAMTNLVFNAVDALPEGGTIRVAVTRMGARVDVAVTDTGVGMPPRVIERAFEPFFTTKGERGSGLGLAQVYGAVRRHGGLVEINSKPGHGTTVRMTFPAADPPSAAEDGATVVDAVRSLRVLVVDDEPRLASVGALLLRGEGHRADAAASGEEALARLAGERFDVVVTDLGLGVGMNGWEVAARVKERWPTTGVVLATGWGGGIDPADARRRGVEAVVSKPYRAHHLHEALLAAARGACADRVPSDSVAASTS